MRHRRSDQRDLGVATARRIVWMDAGSEPHVRLVLCQRLHFANRLTAFADTGSRYHARDLRRTCPREDGGSPPDRASRYPASRWQ